MEHWPKWDTELNKAEINQAFQLGNQGTMIPMSGQQLKFTITQLQKGSFYQVRTKMPLGHLDMERTIVRHGEECTFRDEISFGGLSGNIFALFLGGKFKKVLPSVIENFKRQVEQLAKTSNP